MGRTDSCKGEDTSDEHYTLIPVPRIELEAGQLATVLMRNSRKRMPNG